MEQIGTSLLLRNPRPNPFTIPLSMNALPRKLHYSQGEEFFISLVKAVDIPSFSIHHDVKVKVPSKVYLEKIQSVIDQIGLQCPDIFEGLSYVFDPTDVLRPLFFSMYKVDSMQYIYLFRFNLVPRLSYVTILEAGTNDTTPSFRTEKIFIEAEIVPLNGVERVPEGFQLKVLQSISETWIGETGRGYFVQGIWLDRELTKFFSKLFTPEGKKLYPFYPFNCRYRAVCSPVIDLSPQGRRQTLTNLHIVRSFLERHMRSIENTLQVEDFSETLDTFKELKNLTGENSVTEYLSKYEVSAYLNDQEMKEYELTIKT